jgi:hypothetical protein
MLRPPAAERQRDKERNGPPACLRREQQSVVGDGSLHRLGKHHQYLLPRQLASAKDKRQARSWQNRFMECCCYGITCDGETPR